MSHRIDIHRPEFRALVQFLFYALLEHEQHTRRPHDEQRRATQLERHHARTSPAH